MAEFTLRSWLGLRCLLDRCPHRTARGLSYCADCLAVQGYDDGRVVPYGTRYDPEELVPTCSFCGSQHWLGGRITGSSTMIQCDVCGAQFNYQAYGGRVLRFDTLRDPQKGYKSAWPRP